MSRTATMFPSAQDWHLPPEIVVREGGRVQKIYIGCLPDGARVLDVTRDGVCLFNAVLPAEAAAVLAGLLAGEAGDAQEVRQAARMGEMGAVKAERPLDSYEEAALDSAAAKPVVNDFLLRGQSAP